MDKAMTKVTPEKAEKVKKQKKDRSLQTQKARAGWLFIMPFLIGFFLFYLPMIVDSIKYSFCEIEITQGITLTPVGFKNYAYAFLEDTKFVDILLGSLQSLAFDVPAIVIFSLFMAVLLNQKMKGRAIFRAIFFIPVIVSTGIIESIDLQNTLASMMQEVSSTDTTGMQTTSSGQELISVLDIQFLFANMKVGAEVVQYAVQMVNGVYDIINKSGVQMLIFLAGLQSISPAIYESCSIDGATAWETFWKITLPMISPMILVNTVYTVIDSFTSQSNQVMSYINTVYQKSQEHATAMSWIYFVIIIAILAFVGGVLSLFVFYQRRDK